MKWDVTRALIQMRGMEHAVRLLLAAFDRELCRTGLVWDH